MKYYIKQVVCATIEAKNEDEAMDIWYDQNQVEFTYLDNTLEISEATND